jgi:DNA-directed RNA polymerase subunit H (RpoH/RPB5)
MSEASSTIISKIGKSRKILLEQLESRGFDVSEYKSFSNNEINSLSKNNQLDMLLVSDDKKVKIIYHLHKILRPNTVLDYYEEYFNLEESLTNDDDLIIIQQGEPNDSLITCISNLYAQKQVFVNIYNLERLQFNVLNHALVPEHTIVSPDELEVINNKYNITQPKQYPEISRFDPVSLAIGLRPGQVCKIVRSSKTALTTNYYRICS